MKKIISLLLLCFPLLLTSHNKTEEEFSNKTFGLSLVPQYAISNGMRIDLDFKLNDKNHWLVAAPQFYFRQNPTTWDYNSMYGLGIELQHKIYLKREFKYVNPYLAYGPVFNYFSVNDDGYSAYGFTENGTNYIGLEDGEMNTKIFKTGGNVIMGIHYFLLDRLFVDFYLGAGIRFSFDDKTSGFHENYNDWWGDLGYSGTLMTGGFRFGVMF